MVPERVGRHVRGGDEPEEERSEREWKDAFLEALSFWATGVTILAVRDTDSGRVHALTVSAFMPVSIDPPLVVAALGANASALPYLEPGSRYAISLLRDDQKGLASRYADTLPVGPSPFPDEGPPRVRGSLASFVCQVEEMLVRGDHTLVFGKVIEAATGEAESALVYFRRGYRSVGRHRSSGSGGDA